VVGLKRMSHASPPLNAILYTYIKRPHMLTLNKLDTTRASRYLAWREQAVINNVLCLHLLDLSTVVERGTR